MLPVKKHPSNSDTQPYPNQKGTDKVGKLPAREFSTGGSKPAHDDAHAHIAHHLQSRNKY